MSEHADFLKQAIKLSAQNVAKNAGGPFGAIIVKGGKIVGRGVNKVTSSNDPTAHAEVVAIRKASKKLRSFELKGCILYTSCEPCPMCLAAAYWARLDAVYFANNRSDAAAIGFSDADIYEEIKRDLIDRYLPIHEIKLEEAAEVFRNWEKSPAKISY